MVDECTVQAAITIWRAGIQAGGMSGDPVFDAASQFLSDLFRPGVEAPSSGTESDQNLACDGVAQSVLDYIESLAPEPRRKAVDWVLQCSAYEPHGFYKIDSDHKEVRLTPQQLGAIKDLVSQIKVPGSTIGFEMEPGINDGYRITQ